MNIDELKKSNFLQRKDVVGPSGQGILVTVDHAESMNVAPQGQPEQVKRVLYFKELDKPLVMNFTNAETIAMITGQRDDDNWEGHKIVLFDDPMVRMGTQIKGGIRVRAPRTPVKAVRKDDPKPISDFIKPQAQVEAGDEDEGNPY